MAHKRVTAEPALHSWIDVDNAMHDIHEAQNTMTEIEAAKNRMIDAAKADYAKLAEPLQNRIKRLEADIREYVAAHRAEMDGKSRRMTFGTVGYRLSSKLMAPAAKLADIIRAVKQLGLTDCIKTTEQLDKDALKRLPADKLAATGAYIKQVDEFYYDIDHESMADTQ